MSTVRSPTAESRRTRNVTAYIPPQHGAWAFLVVPLLVGFTIAPFRWVAVLFATAWIVAYPVGYFGGRALATRLRRGTWTRLARREARRAVPWGVALVVLGLPLVVLCPWLLPVVWLLGVSGAGWAWPEVPAVPTALLWATAATFAFLFGSVLHVKSLLREASNRRFHWLSVAYHALVLVGFAFVSPWWLLGFAPALVRALVLKPGLRPALIGAIEAVVSVCFLFAAALAG